MGSGKQKAPADGEEKRQGDTGTRGHGEAETLSGQYPAPGNQHSSIAIIAITRSGVNLTLQIQASLPGCVCYVPKRHHFALTLGAVGFDRLGAVVPELWHRFRALVFVMATGIVVRHIAPLLKHKTLDPAVVVLDEKGKFVISLVSGHLGGANRLAEAVAHMTGGQAVITTASDVQDRPAIDLIAQELGLEIENPEVLPTVARCFLEHERVRVFDPEHRLEPYLKDEEIIVWCEREAIATDRLGEGPGIWVSERLAPENQPYLLLRPRNLVVGIGCNRGTPADEIIALMRTVFHRERLSLVSIRNLASIDVKLDESGILETGKLLGKPVHFYSRQEIEKVAVPNPSPMVLAHMGVESVCEATALLSAQSSELIIAKQKTANVTLAVARVGFPL
jgi:cobalt-precorrin 5A hydrolase